MLFSLTVILIFSNILFFIGILGFIFALKSNFFIIIAVETMFISINVNFLFFSIYLNSIQGISFVFYIIIISAAELAILLSFFIVYYKRVYLLENVVCLKNLKL